MLRSAVCCVVFALVSSFSVSPARSVSAAQEAAEEQPSAAQEQAQKTLESIAWLAGPAQGELGSRASVATPEGLVFANAADTRKLLELMQNQTDGDELGMVATPDLDWFVVFEFNESGYVSDDEQNELDADELLETLQEGQAAANEVRRERGWDTLEVVGWARPPYYDTRSKNLEWATRLRAGDGTESVNHNSRALGRHGVMEVTLAVSPEDYEIALPKLHDLLDGFAFNSGERYSEFTSGDKVAKYGLTALIAGGAGAVAAKTGLLGKFWKLIVGGLVAAGVFLKRVFTGRGKETAQRRGRTTGESAARTSSPTETSHAPREPRRDAHAAAADARKVAGDGDDSDDGPARPPRG